MDERQLYWEQKRASSLGFKVDKLSRDEITECLRKFDDQIDGHLKDGKSLLDAIKLSCITIG